MTHSTENVSSIASKAVVASSPLACELLKQLMRGENLSEDAAGELLSILIDDTTSDAQIAALLTALALKGECVNELTGLAAAMRACSLRVRSQHKNFIDTAGTGASTVKTFNVSTAAAFVIAGAGLPVAKHGARASTSTSGSADVLSALGVRIEAMPEIAAELLNELGICFMFAPLYHCATARVAKVRRELGIQTIFNLIGPLTNPARAPFQLLGVARPDMREALAHAALRLGIERVWVVSGQDGLDEVTLNGETAVAEAKDGKVSTFTIAPEDFGLARSLMLDLQRAGAQENAATISDVLSGTRRERCAAAYHY
ncbi:MAG: anthranilate phosphoribosyltransferase [Pyrinomonadaceae bacterium]